MAKQNTNAIKLLKTLHKVQQGVLYSEKYARLFDSHIQSVAIHEASHAVIATMLGLKVALVEIEIEKELFNGSETITSGQVILEPDDARRLKMDHTGKVLEAAIAMVSSMTSAFKFEWDIEAYLVESGFDGDKSMLEALKDDVAIVEAAALLAWMVPQPRVVDAIVTLAEILNEKKTMFGQEVRDLVDRCEAKSTGVFEKKEASKGKRFVHHLTLGESLSLPLRNIGTFDEKGTMMLCHPEHTAFKFLGTNLVIVSVIMKDANEEMFIAFTVEPPEFLTNTESPTTVK